MKTKLILFLIVASTTLQGQGIMKMSHENEISDLIDKMTLKEKVGQMTQVTLEVLLKEKDGKLVEPHELDQAKLEKVISDYGVGSVLNFAGYVYPREQWLELVSGIQKQAVKKTDNNIPVLYGIDAIHGMNYTTGATLFPQQIGQAATWNPDLVKEAARITAYETRASAIHWNFSPVLGVGRTPVWPRFWETFGEDVHLVTTLGTAMIEGFEGDDVSDKERVAACMKHYAGYSMPLSGKDRTPAWIPERMFREFFLPPFEAAVDAGVHTAMINSGEINGIPVHTDDFLLQDILRDELSFKGLAVSDWEDIKYLHDRHKVASSQREAVKMAVDAGVDMSMVPMDLSFADYLLDLVESGEISEERIDESVRRILRVKFSLGLFETPVTYPKDYPEFGSEKFRKVSLETARESITLLKNKNDILPFGKDAKVLITGPTANSMVPLNGGWSYTWQGRRTDEFAGEYNTILEAFQQDLGEENTLFAQGVDFDGNLNLVEVKEKAEESDYILLCLGENSYTEKPGDINTLALDENQELLAKTAFETGKPVILILAQGRPRIIRSIEPQTDAVLMAYLPGNEGANAIVDIMLGEVNPSGKLPFSYPRYENDLLPYDHKFTSAIDTENGLNAYNPQYPFGFGMSYTTFEYKNLKLDKDKLNRSEKLNISVEVSNTGDRAGKEVVELYVTDNYASVTPSVKRLRDFTKIELRPGETKTVSFTLDPSQLKFVGRDNNWVLENGEFTIEINNMSDNFNLID